MDSELAPLLTAIEAEDRGVDLSGAVLKSGWESLVVETRDGWILRFPRPHVDFARELAVLELLAARVPVPIPRVEWVGRLRPFAAYRKLTGQEFAATRFYSLSPVRQKVLASSFAEFLLAVHSALSPAEIASLNLPVLDHAGAVAGLEERLPLVPASARPAVDELIAEVRAYWVDVPAPERRTVLHNDFHFGNLVLDERTGAVAAVWDFSCVSLGEPSFDLRYLMKAPRLVELLSNTYTIRGGHPLNLPAAENARRLEAVTDALDLGEPETIPDLVRSWS
ncbi:phosphotransferase family protein [Tenggerimyces flavus]|uniref:Phosphotransferase family protein n=1 Tax=Tenggerimyces flavus TaxID=1708749 RepID=A0ABV7YIC6_9ACTN|nr:aminoglycoside phosphotransferase family protein [Tenggerimyces flavus]MBM7784148.1 aminoglycoside phosphotransferase (APT) family kinase protein [Tenggerimyces flavus]